MHNVLHVCNLYHPNGSGVASVIDTIMTNTATRYAFSVMAGSPDPVSIVPDVKAIPAQKIMTLSRISRYLFGATTPITKESIIGMNDNYNLYHYHTLWPCSVFPLALRTHNAPTILTLHGGLSHLKNIGINKIYLSLIRMALSNVTCVIALSDEEKIEVQNLSPNANVKIIHNGINCQINQCQSNAEKSDIIFVGSINELKGVNDLLLVAKRLHEKKYKNKFILIGDVHLHGIDAENVELKGRLSFDEIVDYYQRALCLVLPSYSEGMPMVILEAMCHGLPVVATKVGGIPEMVDNGKTGFLISPSDHGSLEQKLKSLIDNKSLARKMGREARMKFESDFTGEIMAKQYFETYEKLLSSLLSG